jgi:arginyl-tRNA synthetase
MVSGKKAEEIIPELENMDQVEWAKSVGPGFINIKLNDSAVKGELKDIVSDASKYGSGQAEGEVLFEMVSSNPTGPLHIGHGRGAAIGDSLARIFSRIGYDVYKEYYVNDAGNQMGLLGQSIFNVMEGKEIPEKGYKGDYINEVAEKLKHCDSPEECTREGGAMILQEHMDSLKEFGVEYHSIFHETSLFENGKVAEVIEMLKEKGLTEERDGALWFKSTQFGDDQDRVLIKNDGSMTYFASDCAYHKDKAERYPHLFDFWGADHHGYVARVKAFWTAMGYDGQKKLDILLYQLVNLKRGSEKIAMSTREGKFVTLKEVIDEVGSDAARFFMLMRSADSTLQFDLELAKEESKNNPVYYVQYSHARICSVIKKSGIDVDSIDLKEIENIGEEEKDIVKELAQFPYLLFKCTNLLAPHLVTEYLRDLATLFHKYYDNVRVIGSDKQDARLLLLKAVKEIIRNGLDLVGVSAPESM